MNNFGLNIKINNSRYSNLKLCSPDNTTITEGLFYAFNRESTTISLYDYVNFDGGSPLETFDIPDNTQAPNLMSVTSDKNFIVTALDSSSNWYGYRFDSDYNLVSSSDGVMLTTGSWNKYHVLVLNEVEKSFYLHNFNEIRKYTWDFNLIWEYNTPDTNMGISLTKDNRLFSFTNLDNYIKEINTKTGQLIQSVSVPETTSPSGDFTLNRIIGGTHLSDGRLVAMHGANSTRGALRVYNIDNGISLDKTLWSDEEGFTIGYGTTAQYMEPFLDKKVFFTDTNSERLCCYDITNETLIYNISVQSMNPSGTWSTGRPNSLMVDLDGNCVVGIGIGSDGRAIGVVDPDGNAIFGESQYNDGIAIHYRDWQRFFF